MYPYLDDHLKQFWQTHKVERKQRVTTWGLQHEAFATHNNFPPSFNVVDWVERWKIRENKVLRSEKRQSSKSVDVVKSEAQHFHRFIHSVHKCQFFKVHDEDVVNCDEMPMSLTGHMKREIKSLLNRGRDNEVRSSPFTSHDFKRSACVWSCSRGKGCAGH